MTVPNPTFPEAEQVQAALAAEIHELIGTDYRDAAVAAAGRATAEADRAEAAADTVVTGVQDGSVTRPKLAEDVVAELDSKADQQAVADNIATAQRSFRLKLRKVPSQSFYWMPVDLPTSLQGANELRVMLPSNARWRLTAQGVADISLRGVRNGAAARTKPLADDDFVAHWVADADDWLLFSFPNKTPEDGTEIEVALRETDAFKADQEAVDEALELKADADHTHKSSDITDTVSYFGSEATANRIVATGDDGQIHASRDPTSGNHLARKRYVDGEVAKKADKDHTHTAAQVGARPDTWTPTAQDVGARPDDWVPTAAQVGARPSTWTPTAAQVGAATPAYVDERIQLVTSWPASPTPGVLYLMEEE